MPRVADLLPLPLEQAGQRFADWRRHRTGRGIPEELWTTAAELARRYGVSRTARALRVQYYDLKKRVPVASVADARLAGPATPASFVEILTTTPPASSELRVEIEHPSGTKMRFCLPAAEGPLLAELSRTFLECGS